MSRGLASLFGLLILAGALLVGFGFLRGGGIGGASPEHPAANLEWFQRATPKSHFLAQVGTPDVTQDVPASLAMSDVAQLAEQMGGVSSLEIELRTIRVLRTGHEYDARPVVVYRRRDDSIELSLEIAAHDGEPVIYWAELNGGRIARAGVRLLDDSGEPSESSLDLSMIGTLLPIGVGDLRLEDVIALSVSFLEGPPEPLGVVARPGSEELLVYGLDFQPAGEQRPTATVDVPRDRSGQAASALIYVRADDLTLRTIRVFDSSERLVRVYGDFVFERYGALPLPRTFTVTSIPTNSHTRFRIEGLGAS